MIQVYILFNAIEQTILFSLEIWGNWGTGIEELSAQSYLHKAIKFHDFQNMTLNAVKNSTE